MTTTSNLPIANALGPNDLVALDQVVGGKLTSRRAPLATLQSWVVSGLSVSASGGADIRDWPVALDGVNDDGGVFATACADVARVGGGRLLVPATGVAPLIGTGFTIPAGVSLEGVGEGNFPGLSGTVAQWGRRGVWLQPADPVNPGITIASGAAMRGINLVLAQPIPGGSFNPTIYPYAVVIAGNRSMLERCQIIGASHGIKVQYPTANGGGEGVTISDVMVDAFVTGLYTNYINDCIRILGMQVRGLYYPQSAAVRAFKEANLIGWDCRRTDNPYALDLQFFNCADGILATDDTMVVDGNTQSMVDGELVNVQFNLVRRAIRVASPTTHLTGLLTNVKAQSDTEVALGDRLFQLGSRNVDLAMVNARILAGGGIAEIGDGTGGRLLLDNLRVVRYCASVSGQTGIVVNAGAELALGNRSVTKTGGEGQFIAGAGAGTINTAHHATWVPFGTPAQVTVACDDTWRDASLADWALAPTVAGKQQGRVSGTFTIATPQAGGVLALRMSNYPEITTTVSAASGGAKNFDTGQIDFTSASSVYGRLQVRQIAGTPGVVATFGSVTVEAR